MWPFGPGVPQVPLFRGGLLPTRRYTPKWSAGGDWSRESKRDRERERERERGERERKREREREREGGGRERGGGERDRGRERASLAHRIQQRTSWLESDARRSELPHAL